MKRNITGLLICLLFNIVVNDMFSQDKNNESLKKSEWIATNQIGFSTITAKNILKTNALIFEGFIGKEFSLSSKTSLITGLEHLRLKADYIDDSSQEYYLNNYYINVPIYLRLVVSDRNEKINLFVDFGIYGSYLYKSKIENEASNFNVTDKGLGLNGGLAVIIGSRFKLDDNISFSIGLKSKADVFTNSNNENFEFKLTDFYALQLGLGFKF